MCKEKTQHLNLLSEPAERQGKFVWDWFGDNTPVFIFGSLSTHSAVWEQSVSPDQTSKAEEKYTQQPPTPKEVLSAWGPTFLSTRRRLARRQRWCLNLHADPEPVRIQQPRYAQTETGCPASCSACAGGLNEHVRPQGFSQ